MSIDFHVHGRWMHRVGEDEEKVLALLRHPPHEFACSVGGGLLGIGSRTEYESHFTASSGADPLTLRVHVSISLNRVC